LARPSRRVCPSRREGSYETREPSAQELFGRMDCCSFCAVCHNTRKTNPISRLRLERRRLRAGAGGKMRETNPIWPGRRVNAQNKPKLAGTGVCGQGLSSSGPEGQGSGFGFWCHPRWVGDGTSDLFSSCLSRRRIARRQELPSSSVRSHRGHGLWLRRQRQSRHRRPAPRSERTMSRAETPGRRVEERVVVLGSLRPRVSARESFGCGRRPCRALPG
jgi:hypothetical protein